jgi:hypothetical protein
MEELKECCKKCAKRREDHSDYYCIDFNEEDDNCPCVGCIVKPMCVNDYCDKWSQWWKPHFKQLADSQEGWDTDS